MPDSALPVHLRGMYHWDYPPGLRWVPRGWTAFDWGKPVMVAGNQKEKRAGAPAPIGERGSWQLSRFPGAPRPLRWFPIYFAVTTGKGWHFRIGARYDDVDDYTQFPTIARRWYSGDPGQDTSTGKK